MLAVRPCPALAQQYDLGDPQTYRFAQDYTLMLINMERERDGLPGLHDDVLAAQVAREHAVDMLTRGYFSHWDPEGEKPTRRYNLAGGYHALTENIYSQQSQNLQLRETLELMMKTLMDSAGHREAILSPDSTHVGIGFAARGRQLYADQEFITRIGGEYECPLAATVGREVTFRGRFDPQRYSFSHVLIGAENRPEPLTKDWLSQTGEYRDADVIFAACVADPGMSFKNLPVSQSVVVDPDTGRYICNAKLDYEGKPGLYYLFVWLRDNDTGRTIMAATATIDVTK